MAAAVVEVVKKWAAWSQLVAGMVAVQVFTAGLQLLYRVIAGDGTLIFALMAYRHVVAALCVAPFAFYFERLIFILFFSFFFLMFLYYSKKKVIDRFVFMHIWLQRKFKDAEKIFCLVMVILQCLNRVCIFSGI